ncbi:hypothetical protein QR305_02009 [Bacteroides finegoldii]|jgi:hypothetical protein|uniref:DUF4468 domain-containing protein n=1 Tax=Bacteroides finegoldii CL09T03C10 TaxID=997888 RepID=K5CED6_9BACE|nr:hypothetical protein [Bacteroides finegoldii]EKJ91749.1 hypothetical protein HMPREF1057_00584 [Bacteroides finegoldii CL09T03C10]
MKYICLFLFVCISIISKAQTLILSENDSTVMTEYNDGNLWAYRNANGFIVGLTAYETKDDYGKYYRIDVFIKNQCDSSVIFMPENVTSQLLTNRGDTSQLVVYTNESFQKKIRKSQNWAMALYGFSSGLSAGSAGYSTSYSTSYSSNGLSYTTVTNHYDANVAIQANMASSYQMQTLSKMMDNDREVKKQGYLKKTTLHPNDGIIGYMNIKRKKGRILTVNVPINGHLYSFDWDVKSKLPKAAK